MGFGFTTLMLDTLKNNAIKRREMDSFGEKLPQGSVAPNRKALKFAAKMTPQEMAMFKTKLKQQKKKVFRQLVVTYSVTLVLIIALAIYLSTA